ncbi:conserved hypothetical protein [Talaromyces stipitatus ATCC 10500]|uniref:HTH CENPB-type domain-containing protein n=1 Tax=Talaromyces stipitatus (strain ATCC 10500 / CBS 375.48 / QM 6759 / NRRL 1006) TaxID=441959 RepID=B8MVB5_TALSN|nr:uncharacterized protein TSTA_008670 [Talaromyces stipitatus ATCC 10500]EED11571.1 conserved hypothetical protein [Talaromyces stipitatus ATCC 10500]
MPSEKYKEEENRISEALEILRKNPGQKIKPLARGTSQLNRRPTHKRLTEDQERAIILWMNDLDDRGIPPTVRMIKNYADKVLQNMHPGADNPPQLGDRWVYRFLKRLPKEYVKMKQKTIDPKRHLAEDPSFIQAWFDRLETAIERYKITPSNIWNFDKSGFQIGQGGDEEVVTRYHGTTAIQVDVGTALGLA